jgi:hypothetical protein
MHLIILKMCKFFDYIRKYAASNSQKLRQTKVQVIIKIIYILRIIN